MSLYLKWGGIALEIIAALLISREYDRRLDRRISEHLGLVNLIAYAETEITKSLAHGGGLWQGFSDGALEKCGLLPLLREGESLKNAFDKCKGKMALSTEAKERISNLFVPIGRGYRDSEVRLLGEIKDSLSRELDSESESADKSKKIAKALLLGGALTVAIVGM